MPTPHPQAHLLRAIADLFWLEMGICFVNADDAAAAARAMLAPLKPNGGAE